MMALDKVFFFFSSIGNLIDFYEVNEWFELYRKRIIKQREKKKYMYIRERKKKMNMSSSWIHSWNWKKEHRELQIQQPLCPLRSIDRVPKPECC